ncbi:DUF6081 family protein [Streptomyces sp. NPDC004609]|uniref:DUF6081 family protein n=1 Tax=Streptomyces sp. NPDC004609 TaxID=3364704 RepID=UPI0036C72E9A
MTETPLTEVPGTTDPDTRVPETPDPATAALNAEAPVTGTPGAEAPGSGPRTYDDFAGPGLDTAKWTHLEYPMQVGPPWRCADPGAVTAVGDGTLAVDIERFRLAHDTVQIMDNPKYLLLSTEEFALPDAGRAVFTVDMRATSRGGDRHDYRDGVAAFNVLDMETGSVFDVAANSEHVWAIHEMLPVPGAPEEPFTRMVEDPFAGVAPGTGAVRRCQVVIDTAGGHVRWVVDGRMIHQANGIAFPSRVRVGLGIFTLHPVGPDGSRSVNGQGVSAAWSGLTVAYGDSVGSGGGAGPGGRTPGPDGPGGPDGPAGRTENGAS